MDRDPPENRPFPLVLLVDVASNKSVSHDPVPSAELTVLAYADQKFFARTSGLYLHSAKENSVTLAMFLVNCWRLRGTAQSLSVD